MATDRLRMEILKVLDPEGNTSDEIRQKLTKLPGFQEYGWFGSPSLILTRFVEQGLVDRTERRGRPATYRRTAAGTQALLEGIQPIPCPADHSRLRAIDTSTSAWPVSRTAKTGSRGKRKIS